MRRDVVITGAGVLSPLARDLDRYCAALRAGEVALRAVRYEAPGGVTERMVAPLGDVPVASWIPATETRFYSELSLAATWCAEQAVNDAGIDAASLDPVRTGVVFGSGFINLYDLAPVYERFFTGDERHLSPLVIPINMANCPPGRIGLHYGLRGVSRTVSTACASASSALAAAWRAITAGEQDCVIAGGADLVCCTTLVRSWERLRILCPVTDNPVLACRPFDRQRNGLALGDGAFLFVLESREHAERRGARVLAKLSGAFENSDGYDMLKPSAEGARECIESALARASVDAADIDMIQAHGTATALNDATEYRSLAAVFGPRLADIPVCAIKSMIGHTMGASGAAALAATIGSLQHGHVYPIPGYSASDDGVTINVSAVGRRLDRVRHVLINAFGFGGANACLVASAETAA